MGVEIVEGVGWAGWGWMGWGWMGGGVYMYVHTAEVGFWGVVGLGGGEWRVGGYVEWRFVGCGVVG